MTGTKPRHCERCGSVLPAGSALGGQCPGCLLELGFEEGGHGTHTIATPPPKPPSSSSSSEEGRFVAGTILAARYRVLGLIGRGGMGEVYRATDLKLNQPVALKFLPESTATNPKLLERFHGEVRIARQVTHTNVCRVYDIGEADGAAYISMEYVDGEDLASLLRRIGRLPGDKAIEIARQLCAGLAAAHAKEVLHRDLKPGNIMIDGRGQVLIMDFGLAAIADQVGGAEVRNGTPAYMAPEQLAGREVTERSDIYALGLVLYEIFTGQRAFKTADRKVTPSATSAVKDIDPVIDRIISRCLEPDAAKRPQSALALARMLPGGDLLAEALAAGNTPSPEMVAASGETEGLRPVVAWALLAGVILAVTAVILMGAQTMLYRRVPLDKPPEALTERARDILRQAGYSELPVDKATGFYEGKDFLAYIAAHDKSKTRWNNLETGALVFWYRGSPRPLAAHSYSPIQSGAEGIDDPPLDVSGMTLVQLNPLGRLTRLIAVPPQVEKPAERRESPASSPDWAPLFSAAGLDPSKWLPAQPMWTPPVYCDVRAAWAGSLAERPDVPMRIEAAAYRGKPVYFELIGPWTRPERVQSYQPTAGERVFQSVFIVAVLAMLVIGPLIARRNMRLGRGDRRGATRLAAFVFVASAVGWFFGVHHVPSFAELQLFGLFLGVGLISSSFFWVLYTALEPYLRRRWPVTLVSWSRLLAGGFRDPLVGRDVLIGFLWGASAEILFRLAWFAGAWLGHPPAPPMSGPSFQFLGAGAIVAFVSNRLIACILLSFIGLFSLLLYRNVLRREWAAAVVFVLLLSLGAAASQAWPLPLLVALIFYTGTVLVLTRLGLLASVSSAVFRLGFLDGFPLTTYGSAWYAGISLAGILLMAAMVFYAFYTSLGGRPVFGSAVLDE